MLVITLSLTGIASVNAANTTTAQTQTATNSTVQGNLNTQINNTNGLNESAAAQNAAENSVVNATNNSPQISATATIQSTTNCNQSTANTTQEAGAATTASTSQTVTSTSFTTNQINDAAARVKTWIETNHCLPNYVTIGTTQVKMPDFLKLLTTGLLQINNGTTTPITLETVNAPTQPTENVTSGNIYEAGYLDLANRVNAFINTNGIVPNYANSSLGKLNYESLIYMYSKILNFYNTNKTLPSYVSVKAWTTVTSVLAQARPVYITSDNINGTTTDTNRINEIVAALKALGLTAVNAGLGPDTHYTVLENSSVPANALIVDIYGGTDAGVISEMGQSYYKKLVGTKKVFCVWMPPAVNITGLAWLPRAHDDNYDPASFTGIANPAQYLLNNGYNYIYSADLNAIITAIYAEATTA